MRMLASLLLATALAAGDVPAVPPVVPPSCAAMYATWDEMSRKLTEQARACGADAQKAGLTDLQAVLVERMQALKGIPEARTLADEARIRELSSVVERLKEHLVRANQSLEQVDDRIKELKPAEIEAVGAAIQGRLTTLLSDLRTRVSSDQPLTRPDGRDDALARSALRILIDVRQGVRQGTDQQGSEPATLTAMQASADRIAKACIVALSAPATAVPEHLRNDLQRLEYMGNLWSSAWQSVLRVQQQGNQNGAEAHPAIAAALEATIGESTAGLTTLEKAITGTLIDPTTAGTLEKLQESGNRLNTRLQRLAEISSTWNQLEEAGSSLKRLPKTVRQHPKLKVVLDDLEAQRTALLAQDPLALINAQDDNDYSDGLQQRLYMLRESISLVIEPLTELNDDNAKALERAATAAEGTPLRQRFDALTESIIAIHTCRLHQAKVAETQRKLQAREAHLQQLESGWQQRVYQASGQLREALQAGDIEQGNVEVDPEQLLKDIPADPAPAPEGKF